MTIEIVTCVLWCALFAACWFVRKQAREPVVTQQQKLALLESSHHLLLAGIAGSLLIVLLSFLLMDPARPVGFEVWQFSGFLFISAILARIYAAQAVLEKEAVPEQDRSLNILSGHLKDVSKRIETLDQHMVDNMIEISRSARNMSDQFASLKIIPDRNKTEPFDEMFEVFSEIKMALKAQAEPKIVDVRLAPDQLKAMRQPTQPETMKLDQTQFHVLLKILGDVKDGANGSERIWNKVTDHLEKFSLEIRNFSTKIQTDYNRTNVPGIETFEESLRVWKEYLASAHARDIEFQQRILDYMQRQDTHGAKLDHIMQNADVWRQAVEQLLPQLTQLTSEATTFLDEWRIGQSIPSPLVSYSISHKVYEPGILANQAKQEIDLTVTNPDQIRVVKFRPGIALIKEVWDSYRMVAQATTLVQQQVNLLCNSLRAAKPNEVEPEDGEQSVSAAVYYNKEIKAISKELELCRDGRQFTEHQISFEKLLQMIWDAEFASEKILRRPDCDMYLVTPSFMVGESPAIENLWQQSSVPPRIAMLMMPLKKQLTLLVRCLLETSQQVFAFYTQEPPYAQENLGMILAPNLLRMQDLVQEINASTLTFRELEEQQNDLLRVTFSKANWRSKKKLPSLNRRAS